MELDLDPALGIPGDTHSQYNAASTFKSPSELQPGDLIFYNSLDGKHLNEHVAIYLGNHKIVDAPQTYFKGSQTEHDYVHIEHMDTPGGYPLPKYGYARSSRF